MPTPHFPVCSQKTKAGFELSAARWSRWWRRLFGSKPGSSRNKKRGFLAVAELFFSMAIAHSTEGIAAWASIREAPWNKRRVSKISLGKNFAWDFSKYRQKGTARRRQPASCPSRARPQLHTAHSLWIEFEFGGGGGVCWRLFADDLAVALVAMTLEAAGCASFQ